MKNILLIELLGGIGDVLIALPAIQALARTFEQSRLTVLTFAPGGSLLETDPLIHHVIYAEKGSADQAVQNVLNNQRFDIIVSDTNYDNIDKIILQSDAETVVTNLWRSPPANQWVSDRFVEILLSEGLITPSSVQPPRLHLTSEERQLAQEKLGNLHSPIVVLCPDAGMSIKRWSEMNFVQLGKALQEKLGVSIVIPVGSDLNQATQIVTHIHNNIQLWLPGTLRELAAMFSLTHLMIASDTGPARIAAAVSTPTITLFGPSWHERYGQPNPHINLQGYPACAERRIENFTTQSCWYSGVCPLNTWATCVDEISIDRVMAAATELLEAQVTY
jgi:ADP-heptose:LPS heptosyltransferase